MKAALKKKWVAALRSGKYKQGQGELRQTDGDQNLYCCLGVLADVAGCRWRGGAANDFVVGKDRFTAMLPDRIGIRLGVGPSGMDVPSAQDKLSQMNDEGLSFKRIATWIEKNL